MKQNHINTASSKFEEHNKRSHRRLPRSQKKTISDPDDKLVSERVIRLISHLSHTY